MALPTPVSNISVTFTILSSLTQEKGFGIPLLIVPLSANSLDGDRVRTYHKLSDAKADKDAGYISALTYSAMQVAFGQTTASGSAAPAAATIAPATVKVGYQDDTVTAPGTKAFHAGSGSVDTVYEAHTAGVAGDLITIELIGDSVSGVSINVYPLVSGGYQVVIHYQAGTSTIGNVNTAVGALSGANQVIDIKTAGTTGTVLASGDAQTITLTGGVDPTVTESYGDAYGAIAADDPDFFGVMITSRTAADQLSCATAINDGAGDVSSQRIGFFQTASGASGAATGDLADALAIGPVMFLYHDTSTEWADVARCCSRLCFNPNNTSYSFQGPICGVAAYASTLNSTQTGHLDTNNINWFGSQFGGGNFWVKRGVNGAGTQFAFYVIAYWFTANVSEGIGAYWTNQLVTGKKITVDANGEAAVKGFAQGQWNTGKQVGHFTGNATFTVTGDTDTATITVNGATQLAEDAQIIDVIATGSTSPVT